MSGDDILSCYHPLAGIAYYNEYSNEDTQTRKYHIYGSWHPEYKNDIRFADAIKIPCGHCIGCILDKARSWSDRMMLEFYEAGRGIFITLTYNNEHVPFGVDENGEFRCYSLCKEDLQKFLKRVRKEFEPRQLKFYGCGEYGPRTLRPHYHLIIFGLGLEDFPDIVELGKNELGQSYFISEEFGKLWRDKDKKSIGFHCLSEVSYKTCNYVARYTMKKLGKENRIEYAEPEFHVMSRRPGLGKTYLDRHPDCFDFSSINLNDGSEQKTIYIPKYFYNRLKKDDPDKYDLLNLKERAILSNDKELLKLQKTSLSYIDMLEIEEEEKLNKTKILFNRGDM